jgi:phenylacetate-CoA ligase
MKYSTVFEHTLFPLLDQANGTSIANKLRRLRDSERLPQSQQRSAQEAALERMLDFTRRESDFYRQHWQQRGAGPASLYPLLDGLPVVGKPELRSGAASFPLATAGRVITSQTSGSTGAPTVFHRSIEQESWFWALRFRIWGWGGYRPGDRYLTINLNPRQGFKKKLQDRLFRCSYLTFNADNQNSQAIVDELNRRDIRHLNGFSSSLYALAQYMLARGLETPSVTSITATGDTLYPPYRAAIEQAFSVRVLDYYGAGGEGFHVSSQCYESGERQHVLPENAIFEILGPEGPVAPGELGRVVLTQLHNQAMPLIRYELGDLAVAAPPEATCSCGRTLPMIQSIEGRVPDLIVLPDDTFLVMHFFVVLFKGLQTVHRYQVIQEERDRLRVKLVARPDCDRRAVEVAVVRDIRKATRDQVEVDFEWVDDIPLSGRGKRRLVISKIGQAFMAR